MTDHAVSDGVAAQIEAANWYHSFEVLPGRPGQAPTDARKVFDDRFKLPANLEGKRALDIGALDGPYTFELERRGADVTAVDIQHPDRTGFNTAKRLRSSKARYIQGNVYEIDRILDGQFDIICFFGVWYHLRHPLLAFERISHRIKDGGLLLFEGECLLSQVEVEGQARRDPHNLRNASFAVCAFYPRGYKGDLSNWFVPNPGCIEAWLNVVGFEMTSRGFWDDYPHQRMFGSARKIPGYQILPDNPVW
jgi:tRNA (mo5U34)-methyltransferase